MKISEDTLSILSNFASIQNSIVVDSGSDLKTISEDRTIMAHAVVDETFPKKFGLYDLNEFLNATSLLDDSPAFEFEDNFIFVESSDSNRTIRLEYSDPVLLQSCGPGGTISLPDDPDFKFVLTNDNIKTIKKSAGVLNLPHVCFNVKDGDVVASVADKTKKSLNGFDVKITDVELIGDPEFYTTLNVDTVKLFPGDYIVSLYRTGVCHFFNKNLELEYFIAPQTNYSVVSE